jgi:hypothetical protein
MTSTDYYNLILTIAVVLLLLIQITLAIGVLVVVKRVKKTVEHVEAIASNVHDISGETMEYMSRNLPFLGLLPFVFKQVKRVRKGA